MVRCERYIQVIEEQNLLESAANVGAYALKRLGELADSSKAISNVRGLGLMCAFDLKDTETRDRVRKHLYQTEHTIMLPCGNRSLRFRPVLDFVQPWVDEAVARIQRAVKACS
jgi:L-lysine 6-transaminase